MGLANLVSPGAFAHRDNGSGYLLGALSIKINVTIVVSNSDESLKPGPLASQVWIYIGMIFRTSSLRDAPRKKPITDSLMGRD